MLIHWNVDPVIFSIGFVSVRWYSLGFLIGFILGFQAMRKMAEAENLPPEPLDTLLNYIFLGTLIGARLGHCLFYEPSYFLAHPLEIFAVWKGGLASHGGGLGVIIAILLFNKRNPVYRLPWILDRVAIMLAMTGGFIRLGNLMNSEILGKPTDGSWGFIFDRVDPVPRHPTQIYESVCYFLTALIAYLCYKKYKRNPPPLFLVGIVLTGLFVSRIVLEFFKENQEKFEADMLLNMGQLLSIPYLLAGLYLIYRGLKRGPEPRPRR